MEFEERPRRSKPTRSPFCRRCASRAPEKIFSISSLTDIKFTSDTKEKQSMSERNSFRRRTFESVKLKGASWPRCDSHKMAPLAAFPMADAPRSFATRQNSFAIRRIHLLLRGVHFIILKLILSSLTAKNNGIRHAFSALLLKRALSP